MPKRSFTDEPLLLATTRCQDGLITHGQLASLGFPRSSLHYRIRAGGRWQRVLPGIYLTHSGPPTLLQKLRAALLYAGPEAVLTGMAVLRLARLPDLPLQDRAQVLIRHGRHRQSWGYVQVVATRRLPRPIQIAGIRCAPLPRAVVDACTSVQEAAVTEIVAGALQQRLCTADQLRQEVSVASVYNSPRVRARMREAA